MVPPILLFMKRLFLLFVIAFSVVNLKAQTQYTVTAKSLNVRSFPSTTGKIVGKLSQGETVNVETVENGWATINYNGKTSYISSRHIVKQMDNSHQQDASLQEKPKKSQSQSRIQTSSNENLDSHNSINNNNHSDTYNGLAFSISTGYDFGLNDGDVGALNIEAEVGKRVNKNLYWGGGLGVAIPMSSNGNAGLPFTTNVKAYFPSSSAKVVPLVMFRTGYHLDLGESDYSSVMLQLMPGLQFPLSSKADLVIMAGYTHSILTKGGKGSYMLGFKAGINLHKGGTRLKKPLPPSHEHCYQVGIEYGMTVSSDLTAPLLAVVGSYKWSRLLSFGLGYGYGGNLDGNEYTQHRLFARGQYRMNDRRFSPIVGCDIGYFANSHTTGYFDSSNGFIVSPTVGLSLRPSANSYLDFRLGYELGPDIEDNNSYKKNSFNMSGFNFRINFTRTLK